MKSDNLVQLDNQWKEYVNADPDLRRMEARKRRLAHKHTARAHAQQQRAERRRAWRQAVADLLTIAMVTFLTVWTLSLLLVCL